jgi:hypothetical protein
MVFIGDAMEEALDDLCDGAGELGVRNVAFMPGGLRSGLRAGAPRDRPQRTGPIAASPLAPPMNWVRAAAAYAAGGMIKCYGSEVERAPILDALCFRNRGYMLHIE